MCTHFRYLYHLQYVLTAGPIATVLDKQSGNETSMNRTTHEQFITTHEHNYA